MATRKQKALKRKEYEEQATKVEEAYRARCPNEFLTYIYGLRIASADGPRVFQEVAADFQIEFFADLEPSITLLRDGGKPIKQRWWVERTKKASKDADLAATLLWLIAFPVRPFLAQVGAADRGQAAIVKRRIKTLLHYNKWLEDYVEVQTNKIVHKGGLAELEIIAADVAGSHGETPDMLVINELSHIRKWEFVENLMDNADGVPLGMAMLATNAGFRGSDAEKWRNDALENSWAPERLDGWAVHILSRPAPWHSEAFLANARRRNLGSRYDRLWWGVWVSGVGDALTEAEINAIFTLQKATLRPRKGIIYIGGLDLGVSHDHCGFVVIGIDVIERRIEVAWLKGWKPPKSGEIDLTKVEKTVHKVAQRFRCSSVQYDPSQAKLMAQRLSKRGVNMQQVDFVGKNLDQMATTFLQVVKDRVLHCYDDPDGRLRRDIGKFNIAERPYGYRLEAVSDQFGHADVGTALLMVIPKAVRYLADVGYGEDDDLIDTSEEEELTEEEMDDMPSELRDLYEMEEDATWEPEVVRH